MISRRSMLFLTTTAAFWQAPLRAHSTPLPDCEWCGAAEAPDTLSSTITLAGKSEPGQRLRVRGTVYAPDGMTPVAGVMLYLYHTNHAGLYAQRGGETGNGRRHGYLRGWLLSDAGGNFEVQTILPGYYPGRFSPRHIHMTVKEAGRPEYYLDDLLFAGDPLITAAVIEKREGRGGPAILTTHRGANDELVVDRSVTLWRSPT